MTDESATLDKVFLKTGLDDLRNAWGGWKELAGRLNLSVPMLYAFRNPHDPRSPSFDTACDLGILHAPLKKADVLLTCGQWLDASGRKRPQEPELKRIVEIRQRRLGTSVSQVMEFAERFTVPSSELHPAIQMVMGLAEQLRKGHAEKNLTLRTDCFLTALANACNQESASQRIKDVLRNDPGAQFGFVWNWEEDTTIEMFERSQAVEMFQLLLEPPLELRRDWPAQQCRTAVTGCLYMPSDPPKLKAAEERLRNAVEGLLRRLSPVPSAGRFRLFTAKRSKTEFEHYADIWWFAWSKLEGLWITEVDPENPLKGHIASLGKDFEDHIWQWTVFRQDFEAKRLKAFLNRRNFEVREPKLPGQPRFLVSPAKPAWDQIFPAQ